MIQDSRIIGTSTIGAGRDEAAPGWGEIISIYLLPDYFGKGYAKPLIRAVCGELVARGFHDIYLWVLEENLRAQKFYQKNGFIQTQQSMQVEVGGKLLTECKFVGSF